MRNVLNQLALTIMWESARRITERIKDHNGRVHTSQV